MQANVAHLQVFRRVGPILQILEARIRRPQHARPNLLSLRERPKHQRAERQASRNPSFHVSHRPLWLMDE